MSILRLGIGTGLLIALSSLSSAAQSGSTINGPSLGFVTNEDGTAIWPLLGILGASVPGPALVLPKASSMRRSLRSRTMPSRLQESVLNPSSLISARRIPGLSLLPADVRARA